jgi:gliding motility-associated-like protein
MPFRAFCLFFLAALSSMQLAAQIQIIATRTVCVGEIVTIRPAEFTCAGVSPLGFISNLSAAVPTLSNSDRSLTLQFNAVGTVLATNICQNSGIQAIRFNIRDCDSTLCLGQNLVPNPSFDSIISCEPFRITLTGISAAWRDYPIQSFGTGSSEVFHPDCPFSETNFSLRRLDANNRPRTGKGKMGFFVEQLATAVDKSEYSGVQLTEPLVVGKRYRVRCFVKYPNGTIYSPSNDIKVGFTVGNPQNAFRSNGNNTLLSFRYIGDPPKAAYAPSGLFTDTTFWQKIESNFVADKAYTHLLVGHFKDGITQQVSGIAYYLFDDFSVQELGASTAIDRADTIVCKGTIPSIRFRDKIPEYTLVNLNTNTRSMGTDLQLFPYPLPINGSACFRIIPSGCTKDSFQFCFRNYPTYDTTLTRPTCRPSDTTTLVRRLITINGCDSIVRITPVFRQKDTVRLVENVCNPRDTGVFVKKLLNTEGCDSVILTQKIWQKPDTTRLTASTCLTKDTGLVRRILVNRFGCDSVVLTKIILIDPIKVQLGADTVVDYGVRLRFSPIISGDSVRSFEWLPATNLSCTNCLNPTLFAEKSIRYQLNVLSKSGCQSQAEQLIQVVETLFLFVPTAFSPNGDGNNETLTIYANPERVKLIRRFSIFNRWGNLLFERRDFLPNNTDLGWNGTVNGKILGAESFVYLIEFELFDGQIRIEKGETTLMR